MVLSILRLLCVVVVVSGCASTAPPDDPLARGNSTWEQEKRAPARQARELEIAKRPRPPPAEHARLLATAKECENEVRRIAEDERDLPGALEFFRACVARRKFHAIESLFSPPFSSLLEPLEEIDASALFAGVVAARGGNLEIDLPLFARSRFPLKTLEAALASAQASSGRFVLFRGRVADRKTTKRGVVVELDETAMKAREEWKSYHSNQTRGRATAWRNGRYMVRAGVNRFDVETGRTVQSPVPPRLAPKLVDGRELLFLVRFGRVRPAKDGLEEVEFVFGELIEVYEPGADLAAVDGVLAR